MKRRWSIIIAIVFIIILCPMLLFVGLLLFQKPSVPLMVNGKVIAVARQPFFRPIWSDSSAEVYVGKRENIQPVGKDFLDGGPVFIHPFADGKRFLCDYDDERSMLDFVVDFSASGTNKINSSGGLQTIMPETYMASRMTNVVYDTKGIIRLPNYAELQEVSGYLNSATPTQKKAGYFNFLEDKEKCCCLI